MRLYPVRYIIFHIDCSTIRYILITLDAIAMHSTIESIESPLDVVIHFSDDDWRRAKSDIDWATSQVITELGKYMRHPEEYFSIKPSYIVKFIPWEKRIRLEIKAHFLTNDRDMRFSEWWIAKPLR